MKCGFCNKHIDDVDCSCKMCTICGWSLDDQELDSPRDSGDRVL